jgi:hypothetical protein
MLQVPAAAGYLPIAGLRPPFRLGPVSDGCHKSSCCRTPFPEGAHSCSKNIGERPACTRSHRSSGRSGSHSGSHSNTHSSSPPSTRCSTIGPSHPFESSSPLAGRPPRRGARPTRPARALRPLCCAPGPPRPSPRHRAWWLARPPPQALRLQPRRRRGCESSREGRTACPRCGRRCAPPQRRRPPEGGRTHARPPPRPLPAALPPRRRRPSPPPPRQRPPRVPPRP